MKSLFGQFNEIIYNQSKPLSKPGPPNMNDEPTAEADGLLVRDVGEDRWLKPKKTGLKRPGRSRLRPVVGAILLSLSK